MAMKTIKLKFTDCWSGHKPEDDKYFKIAFENSAYSGYTTGQVMQPYTVNSIPIY